MKTIIFLSIFFQLLNIISLGQDISIDEDEMFGDSSSIVDSKPLVSNEGEDNEEIKTLGISGKIINSSHGLVTRSYFDNPDVKHSTLSNNLIGNVNLDVRLQRGFKAFAGIEWSYQPDVSTNSQHSWRAPEMFLDANIGHIIYFRVGKQVLQWGRGFFFNPTDLVNLDRNSFFQRLGNREGIYGAKVHIPFGTTLNLYGFIDAQEVKRIDSLAGMAKFELLLGRTEMALMTWVKGNHSPVIGLDFSSRLLSLDITGEIALHSSFKSKSIDFDNPFPVLEEKERKWAPRIAWGLGRSFSVSGVPNRLTIIGEYYYNHPGDDQNKFSIPDNIDIQNQSFTAIQNLLTFAEYYEPNSFSKHYTSLFATFNRFIFSDISLMFNTIANLNQSSAIISSGISYRDINDFSLNGWINGFIGPDDTEYTISKQALQLQFILEIVF